MGVFVTYSGNAGAYRWGDFNRFSITSTNKKAMVMTFDPVKGGTYDPTQSPYKIIFKTRNVQYDTDDDGNRIVVNGKLTKILYKNLNGDKIGEFKELTEEWSEIDDFMRSERFSGVDALVFGGGHKFVGVDNSLLVPSGAYVEGDNFHTGWGNDLVNAKGGDDFIADRGGKDTYNGGDGNDTVSYDEWYWNPVGMKSGLVVNFNKGTIRGPDGYVDKVSGIEQVRGTFKKDKFVGDDNDNRFYGMNGRDSMDGGAGFDLSRYDKDANQGGHSGIRVDLTAGTVRDGFRKIDTVVNIEGIIGTERRDIMKDDANNNYFEGRGGNDTFTFTQGDDVARGGDGFDIFIFKGAVVGDNTIGDFVVGEDKIQINSASGMGDLTITTDADGALIEFTAGSIFLEGITSVTADFFNF
ncbi:MAG: hypothetical protein KUG74_02340 [Rhodobacteraceae bacterium]|nr:hypothetical protein [Paracoccaceae bacterium]